MKYRNKPVVVEATQWFKDGDHSEVTIYRPVNESRCAHCHIYFRMDPKAASAHGYVRTLEGGHIVCPGDWIITGVKGERYPCKPDIFEMTYESVEDSTGA